MGEFDLIRILLYGVWLPLAFVGVIYFFSRAFFQRLSRRRESYDERHYREYGEESIYRLEREADRIWTGLTGRLDGLLEELPERFAHKLLNQLENEFRILQKQIKSKSINPKKTSSGISSNVILIREVSHFLNTPLSQIEASLFAIEDTFKADGDQENQLLKDIKAVRSSVNICKSFLSAYREVVLVAKSSKTWDPKSVKESLILASNVFVRKSKKKINVNLEISDTIKGYSNNYIISLLLPIIENAVESSSNNSEVTIQGEKRGDSYSISVTNVRESNIDITDDIYEDGYTTKPNHEGMGLSIAKHLLSSNNKASINHKIKGNSISFIIKLPVGG